MHDRLTSIEIKVDPHLVGSKMAVRIERGPIYVSPAMMDLIQHADQDELRKLLASIKLLTLPDCKKMFYAMPMTTRTRKEQPCTT